MKQYRIIWRLADGTDSPSCGVWPTREMANDMAGRSKFELIGPSSIFRVEEEDIPEKELCLNRNGH